MNYKNLLLAGLIALSVSACSLTRRDTTPWLESHAGTAVENIAGKWTTAGGVGANWGEANFIQDGSRFYGTLGSYYVEGSINGNHLYLALSSGKKVYYTAILNKRQEGGYDGKVVQDAIIDREGHANDGFTLMSLRRLPN